MLPSGSAPARAFHKATLAGILHEKKTHPSLHRLLPFLASPEVLALLPSAEARANVRIAHKDWELQNKKNKEMTAREAELEGKGYAAWVKAREKDDFWRFLPVLQEIVEMKKEVAKATRPGWGVYDANLDLFEPGMKVERLRGIFGELKEELVPLLRRIMVRCFGQDRIETT
jgi:carboxypeptidase Taq